MDLVKKKEETGSFGWKEKILANWELINRLARRRFGNSPLAEEAALRVLDQLMEKDADRLQSYTGKGEPAAFLAAVSWRLLEDFARSRFGRRRPPRWIRHLGGFWENLYTLLCLERVDIMEAIAMVSQRETAVFNAEVEEAAWAIRQQVRDCGAHQGLEVQFDEEETSAAKSSGGAGAQVEFLEMKEKKELFAELFSALTALSEDRIEENAGRLSLLNIRLSTEERLLLRLCFCDDLPIARAGEMLGLNRHQVNGRLRRLLGRLRSELTAVGLDRELQELLR
ncbi:sigma factor-like helix-turn-helix DNA-binding protein [Desulfopila aestuarii]|uniref:RNA polymerase sigma factor, sigma-70 family n=1 Tax=Desulfopila aestuarii DSM 18488 TaxID=1121416 RepID=A0A1M7XVX7_9BACT|nr:hypothetical protein [Desulfopila aestuarii]SHO42852.1 RNA polymerase sigma factor, sigma-70 family [Desulfopila aestuarii DSM 18488]